MKQHAYSWWLNAPLIHRSTHLQVFGSTQRDIASDTTDVVRHFNVDELRATGRTAHVLIHTVHDQCAIQETAAELNLQQGGERLERERYIRESERID